MTLRVTFEIVPYGEEINKFEIGRLNIHNDGGALGFCTYYGSHTQNHEPVLTEFKGVNHSRQEGYLELTKKVIEEIKRLQNIE